MGCCSSRPATTKSASNINDDSGSRYGSSHIGTITGKRYSTVKLENIYQLEGMIGQGQFGIISVCRNKMTGHKFACKSIMKKNIRSEGTFDDTRREVQVLGILKGQPNVVQLEGVFEDSIAVHIVMELCTGGSLTQHIADQGEYSERAAAKLIQVVLEVIAHCHSLGIVHRDVKLSNFLMKDESDNAVLKAIDFGSAAFCSKDEVLTKMAGTPLYMAPEVLEEKYGQPCDVWSCGIMLYTMLCGHPPFQGDSCIAVFNAVKSQPLDLESEPWPLVSAEAKAVIRSMLDRDPSKRPTAEELLGFRWVRGDGTADLSLASVLLPRMKKFAHMSQLRHLALLVASRYMPEEQMQGLHDVFDSMDAKGSGELTLDGLREALKRVGAHMSEEDVQEVFNFADVNHNGAIDYAEFVAATVVVRRGQHTEAIRKAFQELDAGGSGKVSLADFARVCADHHVGSQEEIANLLQSIVADDHDEQEASNLSSRTIDYNGFLAIITGEDEEPARDNSWALSVL